MDKDNLNIICYGNGKNRSFIEFGNIENSSTRNEYFMTIGTYYKNNDDTIIKKHTYEMDKKTALMIISGLSYCLNQSSLIGIGITINDNQ